MNIKQIKPAYIHIYFFFTNPSIFFLLYKYKASVSHQGNKIHNSSGIHLDLYWTFINIRSTTINSIKSCNPEGPMDAWCRDPQSPVIWDSHHFVQIRRALGGLWSQFDACTGQQDHIYLPHEVQLLPNGCPGLMK